MAKHERRELSYYKREDFIKTKINGKEIDKKYDGYIKNIYFDLLKNEKFLNFFKDETETISPAIFFDELEVCFEDDKEKAIKGLESIHGFLTKMYSLSQTPLGEKAINFFNQLQLNIGSFNSYATALNKYITFLKSLEPETNRSSKGKTYKKRWKDAIIKINSLLYQHISINGIDSLIIKFNNNEDEVVKYVLQHTFFFTPKMAEKRFNIIAKNIENQEEVAARKSEGTKRHEKIEDDNDNVIVFFKCIDETVTNKDIEKKIKIKIDRDNNNIVRDLIETDTGYTTSSGPDCVFTNHIISHIWGDAFDPRNFTNYWNLAIVPAWANHLLDKTSSQNSLTLKLINTFKAICVEHYGMREFKWEKIYKNCPTYNTDYVKNDDNIISSHI